MKLGYVIAVLAMALVMAPFYFCIWRRWKKVERGEQSGFAHPSIV